MRKWKLDSFIILSVIKITCSCQKKPITESNYQMVGCTEEGVFPATWIPELRARKWLKCIPSRSLFKNVNVTFILVHYNKLGKLILVYKVMSARMVIINQIKVTDLLSSTSLSVRKTNPMGKIDKHARPNKTNNSKLHPQSNAMNKNYHL